MKAFDHTDQFDVAAEAMRKRVVGAIIAAREGGELGTLDGQQEVLAVLAGGLTAVVGALLCSITANSHDEMMKIIADYLPRARENAAAIIGDPRP